ncbi:MAG: 5'-nucleotidase [Fimbriimonadaceae bacterium]
MKRVLLVSLCAVALVAFAQEKGPGNMAHIGAQSAADALRTAAGTDGAFLAAKHIKVPYQSNDLASMMQYPTESIVVVKLTGAELRSAFERSAALYPQSNQSFLQVSGFSIEISSSGAPEKRVISVKSDTGNNLEDAKTYEIAMPAQLGRGGMGYFKIWDKNKIVRTLDGTLESVLRGKSQSESSPRWVVRS